MYRALQCWKCLYSSFCCFITLILGVRLKIGINHYEIQDIVKVQILPPNNKIPTKKVHDISALPWINKLENGSTKLPKFHITYQGSPPLNNQTFSLLCNMDMVQVLPPEKKSLKKVFNILKNTQDIHNQDTNTT